MPRACLTCGKSGKRARCESCRKLWTRYRLTPSGVDALRASQGNVCAVCGRASARRWVVDHDHACCPGATSCGRCIRGVLCDSCNLALGHLQDDASAALRAARYLSGTDLPDRRANGSESIL